MSFNDLGDRMKSNYEDRSKFHLLRRTYTIIRLDGKAFHTFTKGFKRPFDQDLMDMMDNTAKALCEQIQNVKMAYIQSDEITLVLTDFDSIKTEAWFDGNVQKIASVSASIATAEFNKAQIQLALSKKDVNIDPYNTKFALFDARVFQIPEHSEVKNCLIWRQEDATKNSITMVAQSLYSHKELHKKNSDEKQEMIFQKGINWNNLPVGQKRGRTVIIKEVPGCSVNPKSGELVTFTRKVWTITDPPIFTSEEGQLFLNEIIPKNKNKDD